MNIYEEEMLKLGNAAFFVPEGYKYLKWIKVDYPEELVKACQSLQMRVSITDETLATAFNALALAAASVEDLQDLQPYREVYDQAKAESDAADEALIKKLSEALPLAQSVAAKVREGLDAGQSFEQLAALYSTDHSFSDPENLGSPFHPDSISWSGTRRDTALQLKEIGDLAEPLLAEDGIYILYYASDMPGGEHELTDEEFEAVKQNAVYEAQLQRLNDLIEEWKPDYDIEIHAELINLD